MKNEPLIKNESIESESGSTLYSTSHIENNFPHLVKIAPATNSNTSSANNICFVTKPITTTLINTASGNTKKYKTIISNPKNSLNIINISNSNTSNLLNTAVLTTNTATASVNAPAQMTTSVTNTAVNNHETDNDFF